MAQANSIQDLAIIDVDSHISEPHDLWTSRAPASYKDRVPRVGELNGNRCWIVDGDVELAMVTPASVIKRNGEKSRGLEFFDWQLDDVHVASYDMRARVELLDRFGIHAQLIYPNVAGFGNQRFLTVEDQDLRLACATIYNDAMAEIQADTSDRILPMALMPWWNIEHCMAEVERAAEMGLRGIVMCSDPDSIGLPDLGEEAWLPFWEICADKEMPVNFHIGASDIGLSFFASAPWPSLDGPRQFLVGGMDLAMSNARVLSNLIVSGVPERFPDLKFVSVESGIGWLPFYLEMLDYQMEQTAPGLLSMKPSEIFRRQVYATFWFEEMTPKHLLGEIGVENVMFETDFPHATCLYPEGREHLARVVSDLDETVRRRVLQDNAAELYRIALPG